MQALYGINYTEYESGWGQRPDGSSIHKTKEAAIDFKKQIEATATYDCYIRGSEPFLIEATDEMINKLGDGDSCWYHHSKLLS